MELSPLNALSPLDGRYQAKLDPLRPHFSEFALIRHRMLVEVEWLKALAAEPALTEIAPFSAGTLAELDAAITGFGETEAAQVKAIEVRTNHDVKALEYWLKECFDSNPEIRAVGDVLREQAGPMVRCGFDAFEPADGSTPQEWLAAAHRYSHVYQRGADTRQPAYVERSH